METDTLNYAFTAILSIIMKEKRVYLITLYFHMFKATELNYNTHDKKLLIVFEVFCIWHHYLEGLELLINVITDHKSLEYFLTTKILFQFNLVICFCLGCLRFKSDTITHGKDLYLREGSTICIFVNFQNLCPIFIYS